nr:MAG TPA: hypothetical protein [Caudoviricetes sp.]
MEWKIEFVKHNQLKHGINFKQSAKKFGTKCEAVEYLRSLGFVGANDSIEFNPYSIEQKEPPSVMYLFNGSGFSAVIRIAK